MMLQWLGAKIMSLAKSEDQLKPMHRFSGPSCFCGPEPEFFYLSISRGKIAQFKELRGGVFFVSEIPRNVCGKVMRRNLRQFWDRERSSSKADLTIDKIKLPSIARHANAFGIKLF
ncbi:unnamed protein product, partial [Mesorhabditis spiculigera]